MRPIARQSARLATSRQTCRCASSSPHASLRQQHRRALHVTSYRSSSDQRPPSGPWDHYPKEEWRETPETAENGKPESESKLERETLEAQPVSSEVRNPRTKRALRQHRLNQVPKPPPIPEWFLRHNVKLVEDYPASATAASSEGLQTIRVVDTETGHTLFSVEHYEPVRSTGKPGLKRTRTRKDPSSGSKAPPEQEKLSQLDQNFFSPQYDASKDASVEHSANAAPSKQHLHLGQSADLPSWDAVSSSDWKQDPMRWPFLEAETSIRAAFALVDDDRPTALLATDRVDVSLSCLDVNSHAQMQEFVYDLARVVNADVIQLDANDLAELGEQYVGQGDDVPGTIANLPYEVFDGAIAASLSERDALASQPGRPEEQDYDDEGEEDEDYNERGGTSPAFDIMKLLQTSFGKGIPGRIVAIGGASPPPRFTSRSHAFKDAATTAIDDGRQSSRLQALLDSLLDAPTERRTAPHAYSTQDVPAKARTYHEPPAAWENTTSDGGSVQTWQPDTARLLLAHLGTSLGSTDATKIPFQFFSEGSKVDTSSQTRQTIVYVRELYDIYSSKTGEAVIQQLVSAVRKRRRKGERVVIVGSTAQDVPGPFGMSGHAQEGLYPFRTITIPPFFQLSDSVLADPVGPAVRIQSKNLDKPAYGRILEINLRNLQSMLRRMRPHDGIDLTSPASLKQLNMPNTHFLTERTLSIDQVQRVALTAVGLTTGHAKAEKVHPVHVALAAFITVRSDHVLRWWSTLKERNDVERIKTEHSVREPIDVPTDGEVGAARIESVRKSANSHEGRLLSGVVNAEKIKVGFADVHAPKETIEALKTLTSLSLLRPDAFKYGVLANDRLPGLLLYGPPGTGKTMLAKAVAKESSATVLEVSGAQIYEKYVGEGEKMVRAVFSLAKKLSPCIVFIDEADAIFGSRSSAGNRNTHREIVNQFLREWDGMDDHGVFMMVASNRPFDLDDAVLRRLPRRLLVDLPVTKDRESILGIHLRNEILDPSVSLDQLAEQTPLYSGSDLKNLAVAAALACVREENELAELRKDDTEFKFPEKRILTSKHFEKALAEISASISEDMGSLSAIRKFDEQYGDRKGRRKKANYGFGIGDGVVDESAARVRHADGVDAKSPPPP